MASPRAAGILLVNDGRVLLLKRATDSDAGGTWGFPGGHIEPGETPEQAARREYGEECGVGEYEGHLTPLYTSRDGFQCFGGTGYSEPSLNHEHTEFKWAAFDDLPTPLHPSTIEELSKMPSVSEKQRRAMEAAAHGHSTLGIPQKVGKEFAKADEHAHDSASPLFEACEALRALREKYCR